MEKERCELLEELQSVNAKLSSTERELEEKNDQLKQLKTNYDKQTNSLNQEIAEVTLFKYTTLQSRSHITDRCHYVP